MLGSHPTRTALYLVLAPLGLLALVAGQGAGGTLDLPLDHGRRLLDLVSPSAPFRFEHVFSLFGFRIRPYTPPRGLIKPVFRGCILKRLCREWKSGRFPISSTVC